MYKYERKNKISGSCAVNYNTLYGFEKNSNELVNSKSRIFKAINGKHHMKKSSKNFLKVKSVARFLIACVLLAGFSIVLVVAINFFERFENSQKFKDYDNFILPVVMQDPAFFNEFNPPEQETVLKSAIWDAAMNNQKTAVYSEEDGRLVLYEEDINKSIKKLFGRIIDVENVKHATNSLYTFDQSKNCYLIQPVSGTDKFSPCTVSAEKNGGDIVLKVGYFYPQDSFDGNMNFVFGKKIEKYVRYKLKKLPSESGYYIASVFK